MSTTPPTTAREALALAWELAHPVKEGQLIPVGTRLVTRRDNEITIGRNDYFDIAVNRWDVENRRTLDPLPDPEPGWLDAPAVLAVCNDSMDRAVFVRENEAGTRWVRDTRFYRWDDLRDVTPLYPKEDVAYSFHYDEPWGTRLGGEPA